MTALCVLLSASATGAASPPSTSGGSATPADHRSASWESNSYYIASTSLDHAGKLGCYNGGKRGRMTLFFGSPADAGGRHGTSMWAARNQSTSKIAELARQFVRGYVFCRSSPGYQLFVGLGTSNSNIDKRSDGWIAGHGRSWAKMVVSVATWADRHYPGIVRVYGAWDVEPSWARFHKTAKWMDGYQTVAGNRAVYANFSADGCSWTTSDNANCNNGWDQGNLWDLAWRRPPSMPMPQIYANSGVNARQWQKISEYGARHQGRPLFFYGTMTQAGACHQRGRCHGVNNMPHSARDQLIWYLNSHPLTHQEEIESMTDMRWHP